MKDKIEKNWDATGIYLGVMWKGKKQAKMGP